MIMAAAAAAAPACTSASRLASRIGPTRLASSRRLARRGALACHLRGRRHVGNAPLHPAAPRTHRVNCSGRGVDGPHRQAAHGDDARHRAHAIADDEDACAPPALARFRSMLKGDGRGVLRGTKPFLKPAAADHGDVVKPPEECATKERKYQRRVR